MKKKIIAIIIVVILAVAGILCAIFIKPDNNISSDSSQNSDLPSQESFSSEVSSEVNSDPLDEISSEVSSEVISVPSEEVSSEISSEVISVPSEEVSSELSSEENDELTQEQIYAILLDAYYNSIKQEYVFTDYIEGSVYEKKYYTPAFVYREDTQLKVYYYYKDDILYSASCRHDELYYSEFQTSDKVQSLDYYLYSRLYLDHGRSFTKTIYNGEEYYSFNNLFGNIVLANIEDNLYKTIIELSGNDIYSEFKISYEKQDYELPIPYDNVNDNFGENKEVYIFSSKRGTYISYSFINSSGDVVFQIKSDTDIKFNYNVPLQVKVTDISGFDYNCMNETFFEKIKEYFVNNPYITLTAYENLSYTSSLNLDILEKEIGEYIIIDQVYEDGLHLISNEEGIFVEKSFYDYNGLLLYKISFSSNDKLYSGVYHELYYQEITYTHPEVTSDEHQQVLDYLSIYPSVAFSYEEELANLYIYPLEEIIASFNE